MSKSIEWWLERVEVGQQTQDGFLAYCPSHQDDKPSLHITDDGGGGSVVYCFAGCPFDKIISAVEDVEGIQIKTTTREVSSTSRNPKSWWESYTGIESSYWESWGVTYGPISVNFGWEGIEITKQRQVGTKKFIWFPEGNAAPPLWPSVPKSLPSRIFVAEGESDTGVMRRLGFPTWGLTKGASATKLTGLWSALRTRGVREIVFVLDDDQAGRDGTDALSLAAEVEGFRVGKINVRGVVDPLLGEKDLRHAWKRNPNDRELRELLLQYLEMKENRSARRVHLQEFLARPISEAAYLIDKIILEKTVHLIVGAPKMMKTWLVQDAGLSVAVGQQFLGTFNVSGSGPVVYISKEDPDYLLQDRLSKIAIAKGLGGEVSLPRIRLPASTHIPFFLDLSRDFVFTPDHVNSLIEWLEEIKSQYGSLAMVIFDPILRMMPPGKDEFKASDVGASIFGSAEKIRTKLGTSVVLVHHRAKGQHEGKSSYGSVAFHAFAEGTSYILGDGPDSNGWIHVRSEFKSAPEGVWSYRYGNIETSYEVEAKVGAEVVSKTDALSAVRDLVIHHLERIDPQGITVADLVDQLKATDIQIRTVLNELLEEGGVRKEKEPAVVGRRGGPRRDLWFLAESG